MVRVDLYRTLIWSDRGEETGGVDVSFSGVTDRLDARRFIARRLLW